MAPPIHISINNVPFFPAFLPILVISCLFDDSHSDSCEVTPHCRFDLHFPHDHDWRRKWQPTPVFLPGEFSGQSSLVGHSPWGHKELDGTEAP